MRGRHRMGDPGFEPGTSSLSGQTPFAPETSGSPVFVEDAAVRPTSWIRQDLARSGGVWAADRGCCPKDRIKPDAALEGQPSG